MNVWHFLFALPNSERNLIHRAIVCGHALMAPMNYSYQLLSHVTLALFLQEVNATVQQLQDAISSETLLRETQEMLGCLDRNQLYSSQLRVDYRTLHQEWLIHMIFSPFQLLRGWYLWCWYCLVGGRKCDRGVRRPTTFPCPKLRDFFLLDIFHITTRKQSISSDRGNMFLDIHTIPFSYRVVLASISLRKESNAKTSELLEEVENWKQKHLRQ